MVSVLNALEIYGTNSSGHNTSTKPGLHFGIYTTILYADPHPVIAMMRILVTV